MSAERSWNILKLANVREGFRRREMVERTLKGRPFQPESYRLERVMSTAEAQRTLE